MADFSGKYLADKYKNKAHIAEKLQRKILAGATGSTLLPSENDQLSTNATPKRNTRRRTTSFKKLEKSEKKNGLTSPEKKFTSDGPSAYLAKVIKNHKQDLCASPLPDKQNNCSSSTSTPTLTPNRLSMKKKARNDSFSHHKPAEVRLPKLKYTVDFIDHFYQVFRKDLISAMKIPDSTPMPADEHWVMQDSWKMDWEKGVQVPVNPGGLPKLNCTKIREVNLGNFRMPKKMIKSTPDIGDRETVDLNVLADTTCRYDLDEIDVAWLSVNNRERLRLGYDELNESRMEIIMEELETQCHENLQLAIKTKEGLGIEYDEDIVCDVCRSPDCEEGNEMVFCDGCNLCVHQACYGILKVPTGNWLCKPCALGIRGSSECILCGKKGGAMKSTRTGQKWAHVSCALWIPEISIADPDRMEPITKVSHIPSSRWALVCSVCKVRVGACIQCSVKNCVTAYHVTCAIEQRFDMITDYQYSNSPQAGSLAYGSSGPEQERPVVFKSYCRKHSKNCKQLTEAEIEKSEEQKRSERQKRIEEMEEDFYSLVKFEGIVTALNIPPETALQVMEYWKLKRRANFNRALITPKQDESSALEEAAETGLQRRLRMFTHLRQDLERVRNLCYMIGRREKIKRSQVKNMENVFVAQMKVIEQQMSASKKFYPATLLPTLPTFGNKEVVESARLETIELKQTKEWGGTVEPQPLTPSTDDSINNSSPNTPATSIGTEPLDPCFIKSESRSSTVSHCESEEISLEKRSNIGFGLRRKQQQILREKENHKIPLKPASPTNGRISPPIKTSNMESNTFVEVQQTAENKPSKASDNDISDTNTVTDSKPKSTNRVKLKSPEISENKSKTEEKLNKQKTVVSPQSSVSSSPHRRRLRSNASSMQDSENSSNALIKKDESSEISSVSCSKKSEPLADSTPKTNAVSQKRKLSSAPEATSPKRTRTSISIQEEKQQSTGSPSQSTHSFDESPRVTRSQLNTKGKLSSAEKEIKDSPRSSERLRNRPKNEHGALAQSCSGGSDGSNWDAESLSRQELLSDKHHTSPLAWPPTNKTPSPINENKSLRWVPLDGDESDVGLNDELVKEEPTDDAFFASIPHFPSTFNQQDRPASSRSSSNIIPAAKPLHMDTGEDDNVLHSPWKTKLKPRKQLEVISNLEDINKPPDPIHKRPSHSRRSSSIENNFLSSQSKNVKAVGSTLQEQRFESRCYSLHSNDAQTAGGQPFLDKFFSPPAQQYSKMYPQVHPPHMQIFSPNQRFLENKGLLVDVKPSPPPLPDSTLSPESTMPRSLSVAVQATQIAPTPQVTVPPEGNVSASSSESGNEWEVIGNPETVSEVESPDTSAYERKVRKKKRRRKRKKKKKLKHKSHSDESDPYSTSDHSQSFSSALEESPSKILLRIGKQKVCDMTYSSDKSTSDYSSSEEFQVDEKPHEKQFETNALLTGQIAPRLKFKFTLSRPDKSFTDSTQDSQTISDSTEVNSCYTLSAVKETPKLKKPRIKRSKVVSNEGEDVSIGRRSLRDRTALEAKLDPDEQSKSKNISKPNKIVNKTKRNALTTDEDLIRKIIKSKIRQEKLRQNSNSKQPHMKSRKLRGNIIQSNIGVVKSEVIQSSSSSPETEKYVLATVKPTAVRPPVRHWKKRKVYEHQNEFFSTPDIKAAVANALLCADGNKTNETQMTSSSTASDSNILTTEKDIVPAVTPALKCPPQPPPQASSVAVANPIEASS